MKKFFKDNIKTAILIVLFLLMLMTGHYAYVLREEYINSRLNTYNEAFSNVVNYVNNVENYLSKAISIMHRIELNRKYKEAILS